MEWMTLLYVLPSVVCSLGGFYVGKLTKTQQKNNILQDMQVSIDKLVIENSRLLCEVVEVKKQNAELLVSIAKITIENEQMRAEIVGLNEKLENVKTITRTK